MTGRQQKNLGAKASDQSAAMDSLTRLLAVRERSVLEAQTRLQAKGYTPDTSSRVIERALACGLLDDQRFAEKLIKDRLSQGYGRHRIEQELYRFGITRESIEGYPDAFFIPEEQLERALQALRKHRSRAKNPRQAAYRYLIGKGFSSEIASSALEASCT